MSMISPVSHAHSVQYHRSPGHDNLKPHECVNIEVEGIFKGDSDWLVEKSLLASVNNSHLIVPNILISAQNLRVPILNALDHSCWICKGE